MIRDASTLPDHHQLDADICVIGGGAAAIAFALQFVGAKEKVLVLETGGLALQPESQALAEGERSGVPYFELHQSRYRMLGGSTFRWGARSAPMKPIDFAERDWVPLSGWPLGRVDLDPYYQRVYDLVGLHMPFVFDRTEQSGVPMGFSPELFDHSAFQFGKNVLLAEVHGRKLRNAPNIDVLLGATVLKLAAGPRADHIDHLDVGSPAGGRWTVKAGRYVLAAGGIDNPRMLLLSAQDGAPTGLCNAHDLVGRYFMEHPTVSAGTVVSDRWQELQDVCSPGLVGGRLVETGFALSPGLQRKERCLNAVARTTVVVKEDATQALREILWNARHRRTPLNVGWYKDNLWMQQRLAAIKADPLSIPGNLIRHALGKPKRFKVDSVGLEVRIEQAPNPDSRVTLGRKLDAFGMPQAHLHWALTREDKHTMRVAANAFDSELRRLGLGELRVEPWLQTDDLSFPDTMVGGHHHMGTTRMSVDPSQGVVDADCRAHAVDNLYIAGSSVFPTSSYVNPTATLLALAIRLADHLKAQTQ